MSENSSTTKLILIIIIVVIIILLIIWLANNNSSCSTFEIREYQRLSSSKTRPPKYLVLENSSNSTSTNWAGYVAATSVTSPSTNSVSAVSGSFVIPSLASSNEPTNNNVSIWVGIDGAFGSDPTVQQLGIDLAYQNRQIVMYAWFELYPAPSYEIVQFPLHVGDTIALNITLTSVKNNVSTYNFSIKNVTKNVQYTVPTSYTSVRNVKNQCAEWIVEAPSLGNSIVPLSSFTPPITFNNCLATISNTSGPISRTSNMKINMTNNASQVKASTSALNSSGNSFTVTWNKN
jgi:hypothetical protein